jgi:hypothetical protein
MKNNMHKNTLYDIGNVFPNETFACKKKKKIGLNTNFNPPTLVDPGSVEKNQLRRRFIFHANLHKKP